MTKVLKVLGWIFLFLIGCVITGIIAGLVCAIASAQTRKLVDINVEANGALGYKPIQAVPRVYLEVPIHKRFEIDAGAFGGYTPKIVLSNGWSAAVDLGGIVWTNQLIGFYANDRENFTWTSQYHKKANLPSLGIVVRDHWVDDPPGNFAGRFYMSYLLPTGCTACPVQGDRLQGIQLYQEFRVWRHLRIGLGFDVYHGLEQGNPNFPQAGRTGYWGPNLYMPLRFEFPGKPEAEAY